MDDSPQDVYAKYLPKEGRGYPLWNPQLSNTRDLPREYQQDGIQIGDVGVVDPERGFDVLFNVCKPADHRLHARWMNKGFPQFDPIRLNYRDIHVESDAIALGTVISSGVTRIDPPSHPSAEYEFAPSSSEGAILILPDGATIHKLLHKDLFRDLAIQHAPDWYHFAFRRLQRPIGNHSLFLVTGFYKARCWSLAAFKNATFGHDSQRLWLTKGSSIGNYNWGYTFHVEWNDGPRRGANQNADQCVFLMGFKLALREDIFGLVTQRVTDLVTGQTFISVLKQWALSFLNWISGKKNQKTYLPGVVTRKNLDDDDVFITQTQESLRLALAAERDKRWEDMVSHMKDIAFLDREPTTEERDLFSFGYENLVAARRASDDRQNLEGEIIHVCEEVVNVFDRHIVPSTASIESVIFFGGMVGDYYRCACDFCVERQREEYIEKGLAAYEGASSIAETELSATHPLRLRLALQLSSFYRETLHSLDEAIRVADKALEDGSVGLEGLSEEDSKDATAIIQLLRNKVACWKLELEKKEKHRDGQSDVDETKDTKVDDDLASFGKWQVIPPPLTLGNHHEFPGKKLDREKGLRTKALLVSDIIREEMPRKRLVQETTSLLALLGETGEGRLGVGGG